MTLDLAQWIDHYSRAWQGKDVDGIVDLFTPDATYRSHPLEDPHTGHDGIRAYWRRATSTQEELDLRFGTPVADGDRAVVEWWAVMRDPDWYQGEFPGDEWVTLPGCLLLTFAPDGRCTELREYYNPGFGRRVQAPADWGR